MNQADLFCRADERFEAAQQVAVIGMARQPIENDDFGLERDLIARECAPPAGGSDQSPPERVGGLEADDQDGRTRIFQVVLEMIQDSAGLAHAARRNDNARTRPIVQGNAFMHRFDVADVLSPE